MSLFLKILYKIVLHILFTRLVPFESCLGFFQVITVRNCPDVNILCVDPCVKTFIVSFQVDCFFISTFIIIVNIKLLLSYVPTSELSYTSMVVWCLGRTPVQLRKYL